MDREQPPSIREGDVLDGRYRLDALIGVGGYGRVYRATQLPMGREVAVKVVHAIDDELRARFAREAAIVQRLEHPHTVRLLDHGVSPAGLPFMVLELLRGTSVYELLRLHGTLSPHVALEVTAQILKSLAEAHEMGVVHRDIKPENVFVTSHFGQPTFVKVLDFGIAKQAGGGKKLTVNGEVIGTPSYMAPEQTFGGAIDARTDLYAVGLLLAEMVTGRTVMSVGGAMTIMGAQARREPVPLGDDVRRSIVGPLVVRAVEKDPDARFQSALDMLAAVEATMGEVNATSIAPTRHGSPVVVTPPTLQGIPAHFTMASGPAVSGPHEALGRSLPAGPTEHSRDEGAYAEVRRRLPPPESNLSMGIAPLPQRTAPRKAPIPPIAIAAIAILSAAVVVLLIRGAGGDDDDRVRDRHDVPRSEREIELDPRVRRARTSQIPEMRRIIQEAGYTFNVDSGNSAAHTFAIIKLPCAGSIVVMPMKDEATARNAVNATVRNDQQGTVYMIDGRNFISVGIAHSDNVGGGADPACTSAAASILAK